MKTTRKWHSIGIWADGTCWEGYQSLNEDLKTLPNDGADSLYCNDCNTNKTNKQNNLNEIECS